MTQIDASPIPMGKAAAKADTDALRDRGKGGEPDGDAEMEGGKPRFGDHWRSILSGDVRKRESQPDSGNRGELAGEEAPSKRFGALLRLPPMAFAPAGEVGNGRDAALDIDAASSGEVDTPEVLATPKVIEADPGDARAGAAATATADAAPGINVDDAIAGADAPGAIADAGEGDNIRAAVMQAGGTTSEPAARGAFVQPVVATGSDQTASAPDAKARARGAATGGPGERNSWNAVSDIHLATRAEATRPAMKATVVSQATHFAPALGTANIQAISSALTEVAGDPRTGAERAAPDPATQQPGARPTGPVKTLTIQLTPVSLGKMTIEMRMSGATMKVDIQVADPKALEMVRADKDLIVNLLRKAGVVPDTVTIQTSDSATSVRQGQAGQGGANGSNFDRETSRDGSDGSGRNAGREDRNQGRMSHDDRSTDQSHLRGGIYL